MADPVDRTATGLELSRHWYEEVLRPALVELVPELVPYMAIGLVGDGSDCFGFDDEVSLDHDSGARVKVWLPDNLGEAGSARVVAALSGLDGGVSEATPVGQFYRRYTGLDRTPSTWREWWAIPEQNLAAATNGAVFHDGPKRFSKIRNELIGFCAEDVRRKRLAARCLVMGQAGQYNYARSRLRGEQVAAWLAASRFVEAALSAVFLLNRRYVPFYKWAHRAVEALPILGEMTAERLKLVVAGQTEQAIEDVCAAVAAELRRQELSDAEGDFLVTHAWAVLERIEEPALREANPWRG